MVVHYTVVLAAGKHAALSPNHVMRPFFFTLLFYTHRQQGLHEIADSSRDVYRAEQQPGERGDDHAGGERDDEQDGHGRFRRESHSPHFLRRLIETGAIACRYLSATCFETGQDGASGIYTAGYTKYTLSAAIDVSFSPNGPLQTIRRLKKVDALHWRQRRPGAPPLFGQLTKKVDHGADEDTGDKVNHRASSTT